MSWLKLDLRRLRTPLPSEPTEARDRRRALRERLIREPDLSGATALEIARELRALEHSPQGHSLHNLR